MSGNSVPTGKRPRKPNARREVRKLHMTAEDLARATDDLPPALGERIAELVSGIVRQFRQTDGTIQRLMTDPSIFQNVKEASAMLVSSLSELEPIMRDLSVFADKIARHPGELGVQGVVTPDAGLKEIPPKTARHGILHRQ